MSDLLPIVSLAGDEQLHARAQRYNDCLTALHEAQHDLEDAYAWNHRERYGSGFFAQTKPPVPTHGIVTRLSELRVELAAERAEIVKLANGTVKP